jgi:predicted amidohydrolase/nucleoside 2-deoxyribosyltransferase
VLIYLAGPLFSEAERRFNLELTRRLETLGFHVFLPQRDGVERDKLSYDAMNPEERRHAMFRLDRRRILDSDAFLFVLDGRVPDEGACVELGIVYYQKFLTNPVKLLVGLHTDTRAAFIGARLNPMVRILLDYVADDVETLQRLLAEHRSSGGTQRPDDRSTEEDTTLVGRSTVMNGREITAVAIQMSSTPNKEENLDTAERLVRSAVSSGAALIALPELWNCHGLEDVYRESAEPIPGPTTEFLGGLARELGVYILGGSILERVPASTKPHNTSTFFGPDGGMMALYRKIHLFDVKTPDRDYLESGTIASGTEIVTAKAGATTVGLSVCYDVRFPELYRLLALRGAEVLTVPAAFTLHTGKDHWEILLRARAVENQVYVIAPAQWGRKADGRWTYGRSIIVDPWGTVLAQCPDRDGFALATLDLDYLDRIREEFPAFKNRRPEAYDWEQKPSRRLHGDSV